MTDEKLGALFGAFAEYYWSIPVRIVVEKITREHPEVSMGQINRVLDQIKEFQRYHCFVETVGLEEPELVVEHLLAFDDVDFRNFIAVRLNLPYCDCEEEDLFKAESAAFDLPEMDAIEDFARTVLELNDDWTSHLRHQCVYVLMDALLDGDSWVMKWLALERFGQIRFQTIDEVRRFRDLGNRLYQVLPNPVLRGWRPMDFEKSPVPHDDIPESMEDIPDTQGVFDALMELLQGNEALQQVFMQNLEDLLGES